MNNNKNTKTEVEIIFGPHGEEFTIPAGDYRTKKLIISLLEKSPPPVVLDTTPGHDPHDAHIIEDDLSLASEQFQVVLKVGGHEIIKGDGGLFRRIQQDDGTRSLKRIKSK